MTTKLTLSISASVIKEAKVLASKQNISISKMVEAFLENRIASQSSLSITQKILKDAPVQKTVHGSEKLILKQKLKNKYAY